MSKSGTYQGKILDIAEGESQAGAFIGIEVEIPSIKEVVERRLYFTSEKAIAVSRKLLVSIGVDTKIDPFPQLQKMVSKVVTVKLRETEWEGAPRLEIVTIWMGTTRPTATSVRDTIRSALENGRPPQVRSDFDEDEDELIS
jgi:hypothetical protein